VFILAFFYGDQMVIIKKNVILTSEVDRGYGKNNIPRRCSRTFPAL